MYPLTQRWYNKIKASRWKKRIADYLYEGVYRW